MANPRKGRGRDPNAALLRGQIDAGKAGSKINAIDPAAAPLGTDAEAAGAAPEPSSVAAAMASEIGENPPESSPAPAARNDAMPLTNPSSPYRRATLIGVGAGLAVLLIVVLTVF